MRSRSSACSSGIVKPRGKRRTEGAALPAAFPGEILSAAGSPGLSLALAGVRCERGRYSPTLLPEVDLVCLRGTGPYSNPKARRCMITAWRKTLAGLSRNLDRIGFPSLTLGLALMSGAYPEQPFSTPFTLPDKFHGLPQLFHPRLDTRDTVNSLLPPLYTHPEHENYAVQIPEPPQAGDTRIGVNRCQRTGRRMNPLRTEVERIFGAFTGDLGSGCGH